MAAICTAGRADADGGQRSQAAVIAVTEGMVNAPIEIPARGEEPMALGPTDSAVSSALRQELLQISKFAIRRAGTVLFRRGDPCAGLFLILSGRVRMVLEPSIAVLPERVLGPGCVLGLPSVMAGAPYSLTAEVVEDAELAHVTQQELTECLRRNPERCFEVMEMLSREISDTRTAIKRIGTSGNAGSHSGRPATGNRTKDKKLTQ